MKLDPYAALFDAGNQASSGHDDDATAGSGADPGRLDVGKGGPLRIMLVEDLPRVQALLRELIEEPGQLEVTGLAETEDEATRMFREILPDALVVDLNLREGTGLGVLTTVRRSLAGRSVKIIVLTNHAVPLLETACLRAGADHFLDKSRDFHKVRTLLEAILADRRAGGEGDGGDGGTLH